MTISIFEDNEKLRDLIVMLLGSSDEFVVQDSYPNAENIISKVMKDKPDVIVMDIDMPQYDVMEGVKAVKSKFPDIKIIMHTVMMTTDFLLV